MKKFLILTILIVLILSIILIKPKLILADELQNDFLINSEIYLFNDINAINFDNGYIDKELITIDDKNNNANWFGWYSNLGYKLVERNFEDTSEYYCLAIPLNNMLAKYLQFAFRFSTGPDLALIIKYSDNTTTEFATSDYTETKQIYTPITANVNKNVTYIAWEVYNPDYYLSFLPLTQEGYYQLGFEEGKSTGFDEGMQSGYNIGYSDGYQHAITSEEIIYDTTLNFNQLIKNGNFETTEFWSPNNSTINIENNEVTITKISNTAFGIMQSGLPRMQSEHIYYIRFKAKTNIPGELRLRYPYESTFKNTYTDYSSYEYLKTDETIENLYSTLYIQFGGSNPNLTTAFVKDVIYIDLTLMYGLGNEPTLEQCSNIFSSSYYEYTLSTPIYQGYYTGYYSGKEQGINEGINIGETNQINMNWIQEIFKAIQTFFNIQIFPRVTLGIIVGIPFIITLAWFVIKMFRGGGGGED